MKVTYLYHSGFLVELDTCYLLFDYYKGELPALSFDKAMYVFVSHKHADHFDMGIFALEKKFMRLHYFLGSDVKLSEKFLERKGINPQVKKKLDNIGKEKEFWYTFETGLTQEPVSFESSMQKNQSLYIRTLKSTDAGVAFIIQAEGMWFYHAGDLNDWQWSGESRSYNEDMQKKYRMEIDKIKGMHFDVAFVPLDSRQEENYHWGMDYFLENTSQGYVFPMHMWDTYEWIEKYKETEKGKEWGQSIVRIERPLQVFSIEKRNL